ncbi:MAG: Xaa-Pro peptidase family protein [Alphaproteobacteria bacterium]|jgi:Xaa-Pro aminopeptidase|nr:Xaa-Pro peptidase family protein [Alphaproteobacteria bacterium]HJP20081.1 Xaa-Pro peptidase family protein [Alphaproteobacteria bacterium]
MYTVHIDYVSRLAAMQQAVREAGLAALVGTRLKTVTHACGAFCPWRSTVLVPAEGEIELICPGMDAMRLEQEGWLKRVVGYSRRPMMEIVADRLEALGLAEARIGFEDGSSVYLPEGFISRAEYEALETALPGAELVDAYRIIDALTMVKEDAEVRLMRQATAIVDHGHHEVAKALRPGMSEKQVAGVAEKAMRDVGSEFAWTFTGGQEIASGPRTWTGACTPASDKLIQQGEFVLLDLHGMYGLMLGDVAHNAVMGKPSTQQQHVIDAFTATCEKLVETMQPGRTLGEVAVTVRGFVEENGWSGFVRGFGHGIGHFGHEWYPTLTNIEIPQVSEPDYVLEPNYMQMIAVTANLVGVGGLRMERPLVITDSGNEVLSKLPFEPYIVA